MKRKIVTTLVLLLPCATTSAAEFEYSVHVSSGAPTIVVNSVSTRMLHITYPPSTERHVLLVADAPTLNAPLVRVDSTNGSFDVNWLSAGMIPGHVYYVRIDPGNLRASFRFAAAPWPEPQINYTRLKSSWEQAGRAWLEPFSGLRWNKQTKEWELVPGWRAERTGSNAYNIEEGIRGAVNMTIVCQDMPLLEELSQYYLAYLPRFTTLGQLRSKKGLNTDTTLLDNQGADSTRTLPWIEDPGAHGVSRVRECTNCNSQFFHPVSRLLAAVARLPAAQRTPVMNAFVSAYRPLIVKDHLLRLLYESDWDYWGDQTLPKRLVDIWQALARPGRTAAKSYQSSMQDRDLWLIATAAEILEANTAAPELIPIASADVGRLRAAVSAGLALLRVKTRLHPETKDRRGKVVGSESYFDGDYDDHPDNAFTGYQGERFPSGTDRRASKLTSWDVSHSYRIPVFLLSLVESRSGLQEPSPTARELELVVNQWIDRVVYGSFDRPLFHNFFDGSDGWYRVGYHGPSFAYPPSSLCDARDEQHRPCLTTGAVQGWGLLAFVNAELDELQHSLVKLALKKDPGSVDFASRYYAWNREPFTVNEGAGASAYPALLRVILSDGADRVAGCGQ